MCDIAVTVGRLSRLTLEAEALQNTGTSPWHLVQGNTIVCSSAGSAKYMESSVGR